MQQDDVDARKSRAEELRRQISELVSGSDQDEADDAAPRPDESPREFIERRSRELNRKKT